MDLRSRIERMAAMAILRLPKPVLRRIVGAPVRSPEGYELDLQGQAQLFLMRASRQPQLHERGVEGGRVALDRMAPILDVAGVVDVVTDDRMVPGAAGHCRARIYRPQRRSGELAPALVFFHGGGWVVGSIESHDGICRALASRSGAVLISVDYRLAPEHPFPAGLEDAIAATRWVLDNAPSLEIDRRAVGVGGDSAGGNLAAEVALALRGAPVEPVFQLLVYPATDMTLSMPSHRHFAEGFMLPEASVLWYRGHYVSDSKQWTDPRASPFFAKDLSGLPPALVVTAGFDPLRDEGRAYADRMREAGAKVEYVCAEGLMHGFVNTSAAITEAARTVDHIVDRLRTALVPRTIAASA